MTSMGTDTKKPPLVIFGLDAGDPNFIFRWVQEGYLPTIASTMKHGCWGRTAGPEMISEHGVWVSLFSGISRAVHGYYYFRQLKPGTYDLQTVTGQMVKVLPFWASLRGRGKKALIIDAPDWYPLSELGGVQLANWATHIEPPIPPSAEPPELLQDIPRVVGPHVKVREKLRNSFQQDQKTYQRLLDNVRKKGALCQYLIPRDHFDLVVIVFSESHTASHQFWKYRPDAYRPETPMKENTLTHAIRDIYQAIDQQIGLLLKGLPNTTNIFLVSSVGLEDDYPTINLIDSFCRRLGYQASLEPKPLSLQPLTLFRRIVPESWRIALSRHLPREMRERLLADQFRRNTNWEKTKAFAIPSYYTSFVRVNLKGREPKGIVEPGAEYKDLLDHLETDLKQLIDPNTGEPAVKRISRAIEIFGGDIPDSLPDLFVEWKPGHFMRRVVHPRVELVQKKPEFFRVSDHTSHGFTAAAGSSIRSQGSIGDISLLDLAPTFLTLMGEPVPERMTGRVMKTILNG
jgi:predicted AlkP superfamily phosphohydrolase/phosphomutase